MPYKIQKRGSKYALVRKNGTIKSKHTTKAKAESARKLLMGIEHGWRPTGKKRRK